MSEERTDFLGYFGREYVFEFACLLFDLVFVLDLQGLREESLCKAVTPNHISSALLTRRSEVDNELPVLL